jgi:hypothetical protein
MSQPLDPSRARQATSAFQLVGRDVLAAPTEIDNRSLMDPHHAVKAGRGQLRQMHEGAEAAVADQHVARRQLRVHLQNVLQVVRPQGGHDHLLQQSRTGVKQR